MPEIPGLVVNVIDHNAVALYMEAGYKFVISAKADDYFRVETRYGIDDSTPQHLQRYIDLDVLEGTTVNLDVTGAEHKLMVDTDGDGTPETLIPPTVELEQQEALDTIPPIIDFELNGSQLNINATDMESGVRKVFYSVDGGEAWFPYSIPLAVRDGEQILALAEDKAGNFSEIAEFEVATTQDPHAVYLPMMVR